MEFEEQVTSLELSKKLKELGVKQESYFMWVGNDIWGPTEQSDYEVPSTPGRNTWISAFTVSELGEMLPSQIKSEDNTPAFLNIDKLNDENKWEISYSRISERCTVNPIQGTEVEIRAKMLIYLLENKLL